MLTALQMTNYGHYGYLNFGGELCNDSERLSSPSNRIVKELGRKLSARSLIKKGAAFSPVTIPKTSNRAPDRCSFSLSLSDGFLVPNIRAFTVHKGAKVAFSGYYTNPRLGATFMARAPCAAVVKTHFVDHEAGRELCLRSRLGARQFCSKNHYRQRAPILDDRVRREQKDTSHFPVQ